MSKDIGSGYKQLDATPGNSLGFNLDVDTIKQNLLSQSFAVNNFKFCITPYSFGKLSFE